MSSFLIFIQFMVLSSFAYASGEQCNQNIDISKLSCDMENLKVIAEVRRKDFFITKKK